MLVITAAIRNKHKDLFALLKDDFTGNGNFIYWTLAIAVLVIVGYNKTLKPLSDAFLALLIIVLILANKGLFAKFQSEISAGTKSSSGGNSVKDGISSVGNSVKDRVGKIGVKLAGSGGFVY